MQQGLTAVVYSTSSGVIQFSILYGGGILPPPGIPPWVGGDSPEIQTFAGAVQPPDSETSLSYLLILPPWNSTQTTLPAGLAIIEAPPFFDPASWFKWKVSGGELIEKTQVRLRVSGSQIYADSPITTTLQVGNTSNPGSSFTVSMAGGVAELSSPLPTGTPVFILQSDPMFWSDANFFS